jgi:hypothetical protein
LDRWTTAGERGALVVLYAAAEGSRSSLGINMPFARNRVAEAPISGSPSQTVHDASDNRVVRAIRHEDGNPGAEKRQPQLLFTLGTLSKFEVLYARMASSAAVGLER